MDHFGKDGYLYPNQSKIVKGGDTRNSIGIRRLILGKTPLYIIYIYALMLLQVQT
jgi:hypothetical protein